MTHPTHNALVQEWKEKWDTEFVCVGNRPNCRMPHSPLLHGENAVAAAHLFLETFALAAAKGAAEAGRVEESKLNPEFLRRLTENAPDVVEATEAESDGWNAAISQSQRQLEDYFKEV